MSLPSDVVKCDDYAQAWKIAVRIVSHSGDTEYCSQVRTLLKLTENGILPMSMAKQSVLALYNGQRSNEEIDKHRADIEDIASRVYSAYGETAGSRDYWSFYARLLSAASNVEEKRRLLEGYKLPDSVALFEARESVIGALDSLIEFIEFQARKS